MVFNSIEYLLFLPIVFIIYYFCRDSLRWLVLLMASVVFYAAVRAPHLIIILLMVTTVTYFCGIWIDCAEAPKKRSFLLWGGVAANIMILVVLKYLPSIAYYCNLILNLVAAGKGIAVSKTIVIIGTSYFIFQAISYLVDIFLEIEKPERHFGYFALYMSFFPKLLQGPIERGSNLLPQLRKPFVYDYDNVRSGMLLFAWGMLQKVVIADRLAPLANQVFDNVHAYQGVPLLLAAYYYALQIFFDFAGYTDMAIGTARMFNISLTRNFNDPYMATSVAEFWRRWHISFSSWILDYIFKPLQFSWRNWGKAGAAAALLITFLVSGIWHGSRWGFIVWGGLHGIYMACSIYYKPIQKRIYSLLNIDAKSGIVKIWQTLCVFNLISFAWIFFRCNNMDDAYYVITNIFPDAILTLLKTSIYDLFTGKTNLSIGTGLYGLVTAAIFIVIYLCCNNKIKNVIELGMFKRWVIYCMLVSAILFCGAYGKSAEFIYFKF